MEQLETMEIKINLLEAASELAHEIVCAKLKDGCAMTLKENATDTITVYSEQAQVLFDQWYDYYYDLLINLKID